MEPTDQQNLSSLLEIYAKRVQNVLDRYLGPATDANDSLHQAMRYAVMNGGKRIRPALVYATGEALDIALDNLDVIAAAVEIIHCYSLIHDDLPAMDNDDLRRGIPTCHRAFDEATAILAGDALQAMAFELLADHAIQGPDSPQARCNLIRILAAASGAQGMAGGQAMDLAVVGKSIDNQWLENMHMKKTGSLIHASIMMVTAYKPLPANITNCLSDYGHAIGLAFQIRDDILDEISATELLGKPQGSDSSANKPTYVSLLGLQEAQHRCTLLLHHALETLTPFDHSANALRHLAEYIIARDF